MFSEIDLSDYDYLIGSTHYLPMGEEKVGFDRTAEEVERVIKTYFGGDGIAYAKEYYRMLAKLPEYGSFDIIGHFDQITKHSENRTFFDEDSKEYRFAVISSDCHNSAFLDCGYELSAELLRECGYKEHYVLTKQGFVAQPL